MKFDDLNRQTIEEFRANQGVVGGAFAGTPLLLLHHVGAKSGTERIAPLASQATGDAGNAWVIIASKGGSRHIPDWYHNLLANPATTIEVGAETVAVVARVTEGDERTRLWETSKAKIPTFAEYETKTKRQIPVIVLDRSG